MTSFRELADTAPWGRLTALACHLTERVNKAEELTYLWVTAIFGHAQTIRFILNQTDMISD
jgi:hypothetical protein